MYRNPLLKAALAYAKKGKPVFPCNSKKRPLTKRGFKDATTDEDTIREWWSKWPTASIGIPTGKRSSFWVLDIDPEEGGFESLAALEHEYGPLPKTTRVGTPSGGMHGYFEYPDDADIKNSAGEIAPGIDVRGAGGYVVVPPSDGYATMDKSPIAKAPGWLVHLTKKKTCDGGSQVSTNGHKTGDRVPGFAGEDPIPNGRRNVTLTSIAGYLHDGSRTLEDLERDLLAVNEARCNPPLQSSEVVRIARSIFRLEPARRPAKKAPDAVIGVLAGLLDKWWRTTWKGIGGKTERDLMLTWIVEATYYGELLPSGDVALSISHRQAGRIARCSHTSVRNAEKRLIESGWVRPGTRPDRRDDQARGILLQARKPFQSKGEPDNTKRSGWGGNLCAPPSTRRGRHSAPGLKREATKSVVAVIDYFERHGSMTDADVAEALGVKRARDVRRRYLVPLAEAGVLECVGEWRLTEDWKAQVSAMVARDEEKERWANGGRVDYAHYRETGKLRVVGGKTTDEKQAEDDKHARERYLNRRNVKPEKAPTEDEMTKKREARRTFVPTERIKIAEVDRRFRKEVPMPTTLYELYERKIRQRVAELERDFEKWAS